jgi:hypothetical protein
MKALLALTVLTVMATPAFATITMYTAGQNTALGDMERWSNDKPNDGQGLIAEHAWAGAYNIRLGSNSAPLTTVWCIDLFLGIQTPGGTYTVNQALGGSNTPVDATRVSRASWLFADVFPNIAALATSYNTTQQNIGAAIQFALWEIMVDYNASNTRNNVFSTGNFQTNSNTDSVVRNIALDLLFGSTSSARQALGAVSHWNNTVDLARANQVTVVTGTNFSYTNGPQRYIYYSPNAAIPEPATVSMIGLGLIAAAAAARRARK